MCISWSRDWIVLRIFCTSKIRWAMSQCGPISTQKQMWSIVIHRNQTQTRHLIKSSNREAKKLNAGLNDRKWVKTLNRISGINFKGSKAISGRMKVRIQTNLNRPILCRSMVTVNKKHHLKSKIKHSTHFSFLMIKFKIITQCTKKMARGAA